MVAPPLEEPQAAEPLPKQFGKYTLLRKLAAGGMAELFLALHRSVAGFEKLVVIKRILPAMNQDRGFIDMLLHEARIAATLSHPNIVQIFDVGQVEGTYFIAMEHIHGEDIRSIVRAMKRNNVSEFPLEHTLSIVLGMCAGLAYAHEKRDLDGRLLDIVHRDISPQNIVVTFTGDVKVVDFGIAKSGSQTGEDTKDGQLKGKVPYMSPEQASGEAIDWRSDIFATGVMLFELTTGKRLFKGASEFETLKLICEKDYPLPSHVRPGYPPALEAIVMRALAKKREDRYQSAREMQQELESFVREERIAASQVSLTRWMQSLFADTLAQQKEALQDIKQLADVIAAQQTTAMYEATNTGAAAMSGPSSAAPPAPQKKGRGGLVAGLGIFAALVAGGVFYAQRVGLVAFGDQHAAQQTASAAPAASAADSTAGRGTLSIKSTPDGAAIWVNGDLRAEVTPATIEKLPFGRALDVKLTKDGFEPYKESLTLTNDAPSKAIEAEMKAGSVTVVVKVTPLQWVWLDGKPLKGDLTRIEGVSADEEHKILFAAAGHYPKTVKFTAKQGETKTINDALMPGNPNAAPPHATADDKSKDDKPAAGPGKVRVGAKGGFCTVTINGTSYGPTPVEAVVNAGTARVSCKPASGPSQSQSVTVEAGGVARVSFKVDH